ncbi:MAG TPA: hypothetical protein VMX35_09780 [Acidobacteriota bacterium]|nr:hypothetical protein [Acidobacteriota bacterium]
MQARRFLNNFFSCHSKIDILRTIIQSDEPQSGRQIAAAAGLSPRSCQLSLDHLVKLKALNRRESGKAYYYSVNLDNQIITDLIIPIIQQEERLTDKVIEQIRKRLTKSVNGSLGIYYLESWPRAWGSKGKGAMLLNVVSNGKKSPGLDKVFKETRNYLLETYGLPTEYKVVSREEFAKIAKGSHSDLLEISNRARDIAGESFRELISKERGGPDHLKRAVDFFGNK